MRFNTIKYNDIANGEGVCVSLYVQGCPHHCKGCFNPETWDFKGGEEFTAMHLNFLSSGLTENGVKRNFCVLGGEPLAQENIRIVSYICHYLKRNFPDLKIYLWTGYVFEEFNEKQKDILKHIDVLIDGPFIEEKKDLSLRLCGSSNQRVIDVKQTLHKGEIIYYGN